MQPHLVVTQAVDLRAAGAMPLLPVVAVMQGRHALVVTTGRRPRRVARVPITAEPRTGNPEIGRTVVRPA